MSLANKGFHASLSKRPFPYCVASSTHQHFELQRGVVDVEPIHHLQRPDLAASGATLHGTLLRLCVIRKEEGFVCVCVSVFSVKGMLCGH